MLAGASAATSIMPTKICRVYVKYALPIAIGDSLEKEKKKMSLSRQRTHCTRQHETALKSLEKKTK